MYYALTSIKIKSYDQMMTSGSFDCQPLMLRCWSPLAAMTPFIVQRIGLSDGYHRLPPVRHLPPSYMKKADRRVSESPCSAILYKLVDI